MNLTSKRKITRTLSSQVKQIVLIVSLCFSHFSFGQYGLSLGANYVYAFGDRTVDFQSASYDLNATRGFELTANNSYHFPNTNIESVFEVGFRQLFFSGSSNNSEYNGQLVKLIGALGISYSFTDKFSATAYIEAENNLEFDYFYSETGDLFRISLSIESTYNLTERLGITFLLSRAMTPITNAYIITNPQYQARLGLTYTVIK
jgi:hypothetical protein